MSTDQHIIEIPAVGTVRSVPDKERYGKLKQLLDEAEWVGLHLIADGSWAASTELPPQPVTFFASKEDAERTLRSLQRREEVYAAATNGAPSPFLMAGRVVEATALEVKADFQAEVEREKRGDRLDMLRKQAERAAAALRAEEDELEQARADAKAELERRKREAGTGSTDWAGLGGYAKIQHRRRADGTEQFRARVGKETSESFSSVDEAARWRDARSNDGVPPLASSPLGRAEGSRL